MPVLRKAVCLILMCLITSIGKPAPTTGQNLDGLFSGNQKAFKVSLTVMRCQPKDGIPPELLEDVPGLPQPEQHQACGDFNALKLIDTTFSLLPGQKKTWQKTKPVPVSEHIFKAVKTDKDTYTLKQQTTSKKKLKSGYEMVVYMPQASADEARFSLWVKHYALTGGNEDMLLHSDGDVYLNPHARQIERMGVFNGRIAVGGEDIWGGESALRAPATADVPEIYPEDGRLWVEISVRK